MNSGPDGEKTAMKRLLAASVLLIGATAGPGAAPTPAAEHPHWSFRPPIRPPIPSVRQAERAANPVDRFLLARLEAAGLAPAPPADRITLLRRLSFDLVGLPPTPEEVEAFLRDARPGAY